MRFSFLKKKNKQKEFSFTCSECGDEHIGSPSFSYKYPPQYFDVAEELIEEHVKFDSDFCYIKPFEGGLNENPSWFIRVILEIPIFGAIDPFTWGVWVSQSKGNAEKYVASFGTDQTEFLSFGWLTSNLPYYKSYSDDGCLEALPCDVLGREKGKRPVIFFA